MPTKIKQAILITGGAKRIGAVLALYFSNLGYSIALHYNHSKKEAQDVAQTIHNNNGICEVFQADLHNQKAVDSLLPKVVKKFPNLKHLINNASIFERSNLQTNDQKDFEREFAINLRAPFILSSQFAHLIRKGNIINIVDRHITRNKTAHLSYLLAKKSLAELTRLTAVELAPKIRVNAVAPGLILPPEEKKADYLDRLAINIPLKSRGNPIDIAKAVEFLLINSYITGQTIFVDGGEHLI